MESVLVLQLENATFSYTGNVFVLFRFEETEDFVLVADNVGRSETVHV